LNLMYRQYFSCSHSFSACARLLLWIHTYKVANINTCILGTMEVRFYELQCAKWYVCVHFCLYYWALCVPGLFPGGKAAGGVALTTHPHLAPRLKSRAIPLLPL
jgi:hypothetical protein